MQLNKHVLSAHFVLTVLSTTADRKQCDPAQYLTSFNGLQERAD